MDEGPSIALKALHDEALSAEEACPEFPLQGDAHTHALSCTEERVLLANEFATLRGPGKIWLQSLPLSRLANRIIAASPAGGGSRREEGSILGGLGGLLDGDNS